MSNRPTRAEPHGVIYIISAEQLYASQGVPKGGQFHTKIGLSRNPLEKKKGRLQTAEFWLQTFGLGDVIVHGQFEHERAFFIEQEIHKELDRRQLRNDCGKSRESFNIIPSEAVALVQRHVER